MNKHSKRSMIQRILAVCAAAVLGITCFASSDYKNLMGTFGVNEESNVVANALSPLVRYDAGTFKLQNNDSGNISNPIGWTVSNVVSSIDNSTAAHNKGWVAPVGDYMACLSHAVLGADGEIEDTPSATDVTRNFTDYLAGVPHGSAVEYYYVAKGNVDYVGGPDADGKYTIDWKVYAWPKAQVTSHTSITTYNMAEALYNEVIADAKKEFSDGTTLGSEFGLARPTWKSGNTRYDKWYDEAQISMTPDADTGAVSFTGSLDGAVTSGRSLLWESNYDGTPYDKPWLSLRINGTNDVQVDVAVHKMAAGADYKNYAKGFYLGTYTGNGINVADNKYDMYGFISGTMPDKVPSYSAGTDSAVSNVIYGQSKYWNTPYTGKFDLVGLIYDSAETASRAGYVPSSYNTDASVVGSGGTVFIWNLNTVTMDDPIPHAKDWNENNTIDNKEAATGAEIKSMFSQVTNYWRLRSDGGNGTKDPTMARLYGYWVKTYNGDSESDLTHQYVFGGTLDAAKKESMNNKLLDGGTTKRMTIIPVYDVTFDYQRAAGHKDAKVTLDLSDAAILKTVATDIHTGSHVGLITDGTMPTGDGIAKLRSTQIRDDVYFTGLVVDTWYTLKAEVYAINGGAITPLSKIAFEPKKFQATTANPMIPMVSKEFDSTKLFDDSYPDGCTVVIYEKLYDESGTVQVVNASLGAVEHTDWTDRDQQVNYMSIKTRAMMESSSQQIAEPIEGDAIVDEVNIHNIRLGETYKVETSIYDKTAKAVVKDDVPPVSFFVNTDRKVYDKADPATRTELTDITITDDAAGIHAKLNVKVTGMDFSAYADHELLVCQKVSVENLEGTLIEVVVANQTNMTSTEQSHERIEVSAPKLTTTLVSKGTPGVPDNAKMIPAIAGVKLVDSVSYKDITKDVTYKWKAWLVNGKTGDEITGTTKTGEFSISAGDSYTHDVAFDELDLSITDGSGNSVYDNNSIIAYHELYRVIGTEDKLVVDEKDSTLYSQTVYVSDGPGLNTNVKIDGKYAANDNPAPTIAKDSVTAVDRVIYNGLTVDHDYVLKAKLFDLGEVKDDGTVDSATSRGYIDTAENTLTLKPTTPAGSIDVTLKPFDATSLVGHRLIVHEFLYESDGETPVEKSGEPVAHAVDDDWLQMIYVQRPELDTIATGTNTGDKTLECAKEAKITDVVYYKGLITGKQYSLTTEIFDKSTGKIAAGTTATKQNMTASSSQGSWNVEIKVNTLQHAGKDLVVVQTLSYGNNGSVLVKHQDMDDDDQTVTVEQPTFTTRATYGETDSQKVPCAASATVSDEITYTNLQPGTTYTITTTFYDKKTKKPVKVDGNTLKSTTTTFKPDSAAGKTTIDVNLNTTLLAGKTLVVYETFSVDNVKVGGHEDIDDENQTLIVTEPKIDTVATYNGTDSHTIPFMTKAIVDDTVKLTNLEPGETYTLVATLIDKETKKPIGSKNNSGSSGSSGSSSSSAGKGGTLTFKAEKAEEEWVVSINFDATEYKGKELVVFEELKIGTAVVAEHKDLKDEDQTVKVETPSLSTVALDTYNGTHTISEQIQVNPLGLTTSKDGKNNANNNSNGQASITDSVHYTGLAKGESYTLTTQVIDKATGKPLQDSKGLTTTFEATGDSGDVDINIPIDTALHMGKTLVIYEELSAGKNVGATHHDINDGAQTVFIGHVDTILTGPSTKNPKQVSASRKLQLTDTVAFYGLEPGVTYTITGTIVNYDAVTGKVGGSNSASAYVAPDRSAAKTTTVGIGTNNSTSTTNTNTNTEEEEISVDNSGSSSSTGTTTTISTTTTGAGNSTTGTTTTTTTTTKPSSGNNSVIGIAGGNNKNNTTNNSTSTGANTNDTTTTTTTPSGDAATDNTNTNTNNNGANNNNQAPANGGVQTVYGSNMNTTVGTFSITFKPTASNGVIQVPFIVDASNLQGHKLVAYEVVYLGSKPVLAHQNLNDENQTVVVNNTSSSSWKTGVESHAGMLTTIACIALAMAAAVVGWFVYRKKH